MFFIRVEGEYEKRIIMQKDLNLYMFFIFYLELQCNITKLSNLQNFVIDSWDFYLMAMIEMVIYYYMPSKELVIWQFF